MPGSIFDLMFPNFINCFERDEKFITMKNTNIKTYINDLLTSEDLKHALQFEADHAIAIKGGSLPNFINTQSRLRLVSTINILNEDENLGLINRIFTSKN